MPNSSSKYTSEKFKIQTSYYENAKNKLSDYNGRKKKNMRRRRRPYMTVENFEQKSMPKAWRIEDPGEEQSIRLPHT